MPRAKRICPKPGCPKVAEGRYCPDHNREYEARRGNPHQRGYDTRHRKLRAVWRKRVDAGGVTCPTCGGAIPAGSPFDLGHTDDRTGYVGAQHPECNRSEAGRKSHRFD